MTQQEEWDADERELWKADAPRPVPRLFGRSRLRAELKAMRVELTLLRYEIESFMAVQPYKPFVAQRVEAPPPDNERRRIH